MQLHFSGLRFRQIEQVVNHTQKTIAAGNNIFRILLRFIFFQSAFWRFFPEYLSKTKNCIQRRSEFMGDISEEFTLYLVRFEQLNISFGKLGNFRIELFVSLPEFFLCGLEAVKHVVKGVRQLLIFITGTDSASDIEISL